MDTYISLLRGINVSGQNTIRMEDLRRLYADLGFPAIQTYLQSGNVVFTSALQDANLVARQIEERITSLLGLSVPVLVRSLADFEQILVSNPFLGARQENPEHLYVTFLSDLPTPDTAVALQPPKTELDEFIRVGTEIYLFCPNGYGRTKLSNNWFERRLGQIATTRNWKTVTTLHLLALKIKSP